MTKVAPLLVGTAAATALIQCKAVKHGVFNSAADSRMIYVDPDNENADIHSPKLTRADAKIAYERGLIEDPENAKAIDEEDEAEAERDPNLVGTAAAERTEQFAKQDDEGGPGSGTLDSRSSTAWDDRERVEGGVEGTRSATDDIDTVSGDADAPPAKRTRKTT